MKLFAVALVLVSSLSFAEVPATGPKHADVPFAMPGMTMPAPQVQKDVATGVPTSKCTPERPQQTGSSSIGSSTLGY
jgi:hypothetical protein